jgi:hypothetical protein
MIPSFNDLSSFELSVLSFQLSSLIFELLTMLHAVFDLDWANFLMDDNRMLSTILAGKLVF